MPTKKKRAFTKKNSTKFLLLHGNEKATNADGETLPNILVPVSKNYKPGSSLLINKISELVNESTPPGPDSADLKDIIGQFDDASDSESEFSHKKIETGFKTLSINERIKRLENEDFIVEEEYEEDEDAENGAFHDDIHVSFEGDFENNNYSDFSDDLSDCLEDMDGLEKSIRKKMGEYDDDQIGALDGEEIGAYNLDESKMKGLILLQQKDKDEYEETPYENGGHEISYKEKILQLAEDDREEKIVEIVTEKPLDFDCETILSTYSNIYNHPTVIKEEGKIRKIKIPANPLKKQLTKSKLKQLESVLESEEDSDDEDDNFSIASTINTRRKGETPEQKRERKNLFKEAKRESRMLKKENKLAFKNEKKLQIRQAINNQNNTGVRLH